MEPRCCAEDDDAARKKRVVRKTKTRRNWQDSMAFCPPQKVNRSRLGRSPGSEVQDAFDASAAASPSPAHPDVRVRPPEGGRYTQMSAEWSFEAASSLTVAGPRRILTGLPCYAPRGHPDRGESYTTDLVGVSRVASCLRQPGQRQSS